MKFSVLMSIYYKEKPEHFDRAMISIWDEQTVKPNEIILVQDGPLTNDLYKVVDSWQGKLKEIFRVIQLKKNLGLGDALNMGLQNCSFEIVARMDTDDISLPNRFEKQLKIFEEQHIDVCSSWVSEFDGDESQIISYRKLPENHNEIVAFAKKRCPINHPAVMYKKEVVLNAGGYKKMMWFEDYYLWARMILDGARFYNIQEPLVNMRAGYGQLQRRRRLNYAVREFNFLKELYNIKFLTKNEFIKNVIVRFPTRLLPSCILKIVYQATRV